ncbi:MAG: hypothetical protein CMB97_01575 [Flavobacteriaceae bacterium]|nr:hypothetical protein [Flavobacteriaceae bacterium]
MKREDQGLKKVMEILKTELEERKTCINLVLSNSMAGGNTRTNQNLHTTTAQLNNNENAINCSFSINSLPLAKCIVITDVRETKNI